MNSISFARKAIMNTGELKTEGIYLKYHSCYTNTPYFLLLKQKLKKELILPKHIYEKNIGFLTHLA